MMKNPSLQDQTLGKSPSPGYNTFLLKQKENSGSLRLPFVTCISLERFLDDSSLVQILIMARTCGSFSTFPFSIMQVAAKV